MQPATPARSRLLEPGDPEPVGAERLDGSSELVLACDHAGSALPRALNGLGLGEDDLRRHIAWDIGALAVARRMSEALGAPLVYQPYSRLVIDCNRAPGVDSSIPVESDGTRVPGNLDLTPAQIEARVEDVFRPYHETMGRLLDERAHRRRPTVLVSVHSFTPTLRTDPSPRPWAIGVIYGRDARIARHLIRLLREALACEVGDNRPYVVDLENDYTIPVHGERRGLPCVELELSQDMVADAEGQRRWADLLVECLPRAVRGAGVPVG